MQVGLLIISLLVGVQSGSDLHLKGTQLKRFLRTKGASHLLRTVRWDVSGSVFDRNPLRKVRGYALFQSKGIAILVRLSDPGLRELIRKGGKACLRGRVRKVPPSRRRKGEPRYYLDVREVTRRKK